MSDEDPKPEGLSRRDFLRRASKDAAETGVKLVPGASLAAAAVKTPWWRKLAVWRQERAETESQPNQENHE